MYRTTLTFATVLIAALLVTGCASSGPSASRGNTAEVLGTWRYRAMAGSSLLDEGVIQITMNQGRLEGTLRDSRLGSAPLDVSYRGDNLRLRVDDIRIQGRVKNNEFVAFYERSMWDVTTPQRSIRDQRQRMNGSLSARRVEAKGFDVNLPPLGCDDLLTGGASQCDT